MPATMIILSTLNARYAHASLGLRYLLANMGDLQDQTQLQEFVIGAKTTDIVEKLLAQQPRIIGFGVYIWNVEETTRVVAMLKHACAADRHRAGRAGSRPMSRSSKRSCRRPIT